MWIWGICEERKHVGRRLFGETRVQSEVGLKQIEIVFCFIIFLPYLPHCWMELSRGEKRIMASNLVTPLQGVVGSTSDHFWFLLCCSLSVVIPELVLKCGAFGEVIKSWGLHLHVWLNDSWKGWLAGTSIRVFPLMYFLPVRTHCSSPPEAVPARCHLGRSDPSPDTEPANALILDFPAPRTVTNPLLLLINYPLQGIWL